MSNYFNEQYSDLIQEGTGGSFNKLLHKKLEKNLIDLATIYQIYK